MHQIDAPSATPDNEFTDGDEVLGTLATELWAKWHNTVQRELIAVLAAAGIAPSVANDAQVIAAIQTLIAAHTGLTAPHGATSEATASRIMLRDASGRSKVSAAGDPAQAVNAGQFTYDTTGGTGYLRIPAVIGGAVVYFMLQWGTVTVDANSSAIIAWATEFNAGVFAAVAGQATEFTLTEDASVSIYNLSTAGAGVRNGYNGSATIRYFAVGR